MKRYTLLLFFIFYSHQAFSQDYHDEKYTDINVLGWKVKVNNELISGDTSVLKKSLGLFGKELFDLSNILPKNAIVKLKNVVFWFETETAIHGYTGEYYRSKAWLIKKGLNPEKVKGIDIVAGRYIDSKALHENWVILHELAHAYHDLVVGFQNEDIITAYKVTHNAGLYEQVRRGFNMHHHGYASTNAHEYFAEISTILVIVVIILMIVQI
jgi:hypothetical protein